MRTNKFGGKAGTLHFSANEKRIVPSISNDRFYFFTHNRPCNHQVTKEEIKKLDRWQIEYEFMNNKSYKCLSGIIGGGLMDITDSKANESKENDLWLYTLKKSNIEWQESYVKIQYIEDHKLETYMIEVSGVDDMYFFHYLKTPLPKENLDLLKEYVASFKVMPFNDDYRYHIENVVLKNIPHKYDT